MNKRQRILEYFRKNDRSITICCARTLILYLGSTVVLPVRSPDCVGVFMNTTVNISAIHEIVDNFFNLIHGERYFTYVDGLLCLAIIGVSAGTTLQDVFGDVFVQAARDGVIHASDARKEYLGCTSP